MPKGTIKKLVRDRGFGFISPEGKGADLFFHVSVVDGNAFDDLQEGQGVEFEFSEGTDSSRGPRAGSVRPL